jgi:hypothetical protein
MKEPEDSSEQSVRISLLRLDAVMQGISMGTLVGLVVFIATNWLVLKGGTMVGPHLSLLGQFFIGYRVSFLGSFVGFAYGFIAGFAAGFIVSTLYNRIVALRDGKPQA